MRRALLPLLFVALSAVGFAQGSSSIQKIAKPDLATSLTYFAGPWKFNQTLSSNLNSWRSMELAIVPGGGGKVTLTRNYAVGRRKRVETGTYDLSRPDAITEVPMARWTEDRCMGVYTAGDKTMRVQCSMLDDGRVLRTVGTVTVSVQQGLRELQVLSDYKLSPDGNRLTIVEVRSSRTLPIVYVFDRVTDAAKP